MYSGTARKDQETTEPAYDIRFVNSHLRNRAGAFTYVGAEIEEEEEGDTMHDTYIYMDIYTDT